MTEQADARAQDGGQNTKSATAATDHESADAGVDPEDLAAELTSRFAEIDSTQLIPVAGAAATFLGVVRVSTRRPELGAALVDAAAEHGVLLYPALFAPKEAGALDRAFFGAQWPDIAAPDGALRQVERLRAAGYPRSVRRWLSRAIRRHRALLDHAQRSEQLPLHCSLLLCARAVEEAQRQLFATSGEVFSVGPEAARRFDELFVKPGHFVAADGRVAAELHGLARQAAIFSELCPARSFEWVDAIRRAAAFFDRFERYVARVFVSDAERRRRRVLSLAGVAAGALALLVGLIVWFVSTRPLAALPDHPRFARAGGIRGMYFNGRLFEKRVLTRTDSRILFSTGGAAAPGLTPDNFSIRWEGYIHFPEAGKHLLCSECDDGARIFFNGEQIVDDWKIHGLNRTCAPVRVEQGWYPLKVEYFEVSKGATMRLLRGEDPSSVKVVPAAHLCCREEMPAKPAAPAKGAAPAKPAAPAKGAAPAKPAAPAKGAAPAKPAAPIRPSALPMPAAKLLRRVRPKLVNPAVPAKPAPKRKPLPPKPH